MTTKNTITLALSIGGVTALLATCAFAQDPAEVRVLHHAVDSDVYLANRELDVNSSVDGDLVAAGMRVTVDGNVTGDVIVAAQHIEIRSPVSDDVRVAGQNIRILSPVSGHIVAAGQSVTIEQDVGDWAWLAGDTVKVLGNVGSDLRIRSTKTTIDAEVAGDIDVVGDKLTIGSGAVLRGNLRWRSRNAADISPDAQIDGDFIEEPLPGVIEELSSGGRYSLPLNLIVAVTVLFLLFSRPLRASASRIASRPGRSLLIGLAVLLLTPVLAVILFFSGVGLWLGFAVLFIYLVILLLGVLTGLFAASDTLLRRFWEQPALWQSLAAIFVTVVVVGLLARIPWLGIILVFAILLVGIGALCWHSWATLRSYRQPESQAS